MIEIGISLGWNCDTTMWGLSTKIRPNKEGGYKSCPFDLMFTNYKGIIDCLNDDFKYFCDINYLQIKKIPKESKLLPDEDLIYNTKLYFVFSRKSPGYENLYIHQNWSKGINHFVLNNYEEFINRYNRRIQNFRDYLNSGIKIIFIIHKPYLNMDLDGIKELSDTINKKYPNLNYQIAYLDYDKKMFYEYHKILMNVDIEEYK